MQKSVVKNTIIEPVLKIEGGIPLSGTVKIEGAKNATLPALVAACLSAETVELTNVPLELNDVKRMLELMNSMDVGITIDKTNKSIKLNGGEWTGGELDGEIAGSIRHSLLLLGLSVAWKKDLSIPIPGGCKLGTRKHDMHIDALKELGSQVTEINGIELEYQDSDQEVDIEFYYPTFGGTLNAIFASVKKEGTTIRIHNAAKNPEVIDVINMLTKMGANISWESKKILLIEGVAELTGITHSIMPDRIVGATIIAATGATKGKTTIKNFSEDLLTNEIITWRRAGLKIEQNDQDLLIDGRQTDILPVDIETKAYPGFHTDIQPLHGLLMTLAKGQSEIKETILDGRFRYFEELEKFGANTEVVNGDFKCVNGAQGQIAKIRGVERLTGAEVLATDIRGGAAVAIAGMVAEGTTIVKNLYQLERGYGNFVEMFSSLGANITRMERETNGDN